MVPFVVSDVATHRDAILCLVAQKNCCTPSSHCTPRSACMCRSCAFVLLYCLSALGISSSNTSPGSHVPYSDALAMAVSAVTPPEYLIVRLHVWALVATTSPRISCRCEFSSPTKILPLDPCLADALDDSPHASAMQSPVGINHAPILAPHAPFSNSPSRRPPGRSNLCRRRTHCSSPC